MECNALIYRVINDDDTTRRVNLNTTLRLERLIDYLL
jgi:hypothetical protein